MSPEELLAASDMLLHEKYGDVCPYRSDEDYADLMYCVIFRRAWKSLSCFYTSQQNNALIKQIENMIHLHHRYFEEYRQRATMAAEANKQFYKRRCVSSEPSRVMSLLDNSPVYNAADKLPQSQVLEVDFTPKTKQVELVEPENNRPVMDENSDFDTIIGNIGW